MLITIAIIVVAHIFLSRTRVGREFYAIGGNRAAAVSAGVPVNRRVVLAFVLSGMIAAAAGSMLAVELGTADPNAGSKLLLNAIAAAVIGGASLKGGRGTVLGTLIGALTLATLTVGLQYGGVSPDVQDIVVGIVLVVAVAVDHTVMTTLRATTARWRNNAGGSTRIARTLLGSVRPVSSR